MKILVTGGTGFIGSHLVKALIKKRYKVLVLSQSLPKKENFPAQVKFYKVNICSGKIDEIFKKERPKIIYHLAAYLPRTAIEESSYNILNIETNILGTLRILEASRNYKIKKIIFSSSAAIYGDPTSVPTPETYQANPMTLYGLAKFTAERLFEIYHQLYNIPYIIFRYSNVYGPGQRYTGKQGNLIAYFVDKISGNKQPVINGDGKQTRDFIYIDDVIRANLLAIKENKVGIYNVGSGSGTSINEICYKICQIIGKKIKPKYNPAAKRGIKRSALEIKKIKKDFGYQPKISLDIGLQRTINFLKKKINVSREF